MLEVIFIRHGETDWNAGRRIMGHKPIPLNERGRQQAERLRGLLDGIAIDAIFSSPLVRTMETASILTDGRGIPVIETPELTEINYGPWVGLTFDEVRTTPEFRDYHLRPSKVKVPGGESLQEASQRVGSFVQRLRDQQEMKRVLAVSHADVIKAALVLHLPMGLDDIHRFRIDNGSYSILLLDGDLERVLMVNGLAHLGAFFDKTSLFQKEKITDAGTDTAS